MTKRFCVPFFVGLLLSFLGSFSASASSIQEVTSKSGVTAWLVEDHKLPLVAMHFAFRGGVEQDPSDKQGLSSLTMSLFTEGAGPYDAEAFQSQLAEHSITMTFGASRDALDGGLKCLTADEDAAFALLHDALTKQHFDPKAIERIRSEQLAAIRTQFGNPGWQARFALFQQIFGDHPYGQRRLGSTKSLSQLTEGDIRSFAASHLARDNLVIAVAGDMTREQLSAVLDQVFGDLPEHAKLTPINEVKWPKDPAVILIPRAGTQTELLFAMPGPKRDDPDWYAADIANYIIGGGGFSSRLMHDVRDEKGLTYGIDTALSPMEHGAVFLGEAATDNPKTAEAWAITLKTMHHFYDEGATSKEIDGAKDYLTGAMPLMMTSTDSIAGILVQLQMDRLPIDYLDKRDALIRNVTPDDVAGVIHRWFNPDNLTVSMAGKPEGITPTQTRPMTRE